MSPETAGTRRLVSCVGTARVTLLKSWVGLVLPNRITSLSAKRLCRHQSSYSSVRTNGFGPDNPSYAVTTPALPLLSSPLNCIISASLDAPGMLASFAGGSMDAEMMQFNGEDS